MQGRPKWSLSRKFPCLFPNFPEFSQFPEFTIRGFGTPSPWKCGGIVCNEIHTIATHLGYLLFVLVHKETLAHQVAS